MNKKGKAGDEITKLITLIATIIFAYIIWKAFTSGLG